MITFTSWEMTAFPPESSAEENFSSLLSSSLHLARSHGCCPPSRAAHVVKEGCTRPLSAGLCWNAPHLLWSLAPCQHCLDLHGLGVIHLKACQATQCDITCERANTYSRAFCSVAPEVTPGLSGFRGSCTFSLSWAHTCCLLSARHGANCLESTQSY